jgi:flagellar hook-associated protein 1
MSLSAALQIGRTGLLSSQLAIEVAGNNLANAATAGYHRQTVSFSALPGESIGSGMFLGRGVVVSDIIRHVDNALEGRVRSSIADQNAAIVKQNILQQVETIQGELSGNDLSSQLDSFFNAFSELANKPQDTSLRSLLVEQSKSLTSFIQNVRSDLTGVRTQVDNAIDNTVRSADDLLTKIEQINQQIAQTEAGQGGANGLRDQRDSLLNQLSELMDISTIEQPSGAVDVYVGSTPIVLNGKSRGLDVQRQTVNGQLQIKVVLKDNGGVINPGSGQIGSLVQSRQSGVNDAIDKLDQFTGNLIYQVNRLHTQGQGLVGFDSVTSDYRVLDTSVALNDPATGLAFPPKHGSFQISVTQKSTGERVASTINVDLDGIGTDTTLTSLAADLDAVANIHASITPEGRLKIEGDTGDFEVSFSDDTSGVLASLGINNFFKGDNAYDVAVATNVAANPDLIAAGAGYVEGDNSNALAIAGLRDQPLDDLGGMSLTEKWRRHVEDQAVRTGQAASEVQANGVVRDSLEAQQQSVSGVNTDEEAINLMAFQRAFQASARFLSVVNDMMQTVLQLV